MSPESGEEVGEEGAGGGHCFSRVLGLGLRLRIY